MVTMVQLSTFVPSSRFERSQLAQDRQGLARQRHQVLPTHLHAVARYAPQCAVPIDFAPSAAAKLARPKEYMRREAQRRVRRRLAVIALNGLQERAHLGGL